jgi:hypothetical protein
VLHSNDEVWDHGAKYVPLRQRAGTQKVKRARVLGQHVIDETTFENAQSEATFKSRKDCDDVAAPQKRESVSPGFNVFRTSIDIGLASLDQ